jgi:hypothetical protein
MEGEKLFKKGEPGKAEDGSLLLVNEDKTAYKVSEVVLIIWDMCNGISFSALAEELASHSDQEASDLRASLEELFVQLQDSKLLEIKQK